MSERNAELGYAQLIKEYILALEANQESKAVLDAVKDALEQKLRQNEGGIVSGTTSIHQASGQGIQSFTAHVDGYTISYEESITATTDYSAIVDRVLEVLSSPNIVMTNQQLINEIHAMLENKKYSKRKTLNITRG